MHSSAWVDGRSPALVTNGRLVAVGTTLLFGAYLKRAEPGREAVAFFLAEEPIGRTRTFFIYDFRGAAPDISPTASIELCGEI
jgi:hypothetical protein